MTPDNQLLGKGMAFFQIQNMLKPDYIIEVGAHAAEFSIAVSNMLMINGIAFEANQFVYNKYYGDVTKNGLISYLNYAVSESDGEVTIKISEDKYAGNNSIKNRINNYITEEYHVKSVCLDNFLKNTIFNKASMWIDVEGASKEVLLGSSSMLKRVQSIFIESEDIQYWEGQWTTNDIIKFLEERDFVLIDYENIYAFQKNLIFIKKDSIDLIKTINEILKG
jgi:FkbM family methyltransferase